MGDPWTTREFHIKWKRWAYLHCSWDTLNTLSQLGGYKRVLNYIKRSDDLAAVRKRSSREENEMRDVERQMEEQLVQEHMLVSSPANANADDHSAPWKAYSCCRRLACDVM